MSFQGFVKRNKGHLVAVLVLFVLILVAHNSFLANTSMARMGDSSTGALDRFYLMKEIILKYNQFPHWDPIVQGGTVAWAHPNFNVIYYTTLIALLSPSSEFALNIMQLLNLFLAGLFMYYVMAKLKLKPQFAFVSSLTYVFSIYAYWLFSGYYFRLPVLTWLPLLFYFTWKAFYSKDWIKYSIYSGIVLTIIFLSGGLNMAFFTILVFIAMVLTYLIGRHFLKRFSKAAIVSILILVVFLGLFSIKLFPMLEYNEYVATKAGTTFEQGVGAHIKMGSIKDFIYTFVFPHRFPEKNGRIHLSVSKVGITGLVLVLFSLYKIKNRHVLFFFILALLGILVASGSPFYYLLWRFVPGFNKLHYVIRASFIFIFAFAALQGIGLSVLCDKLKGKLDLKKNGIMVLYLIVVSLVMVDLFVVNAHDRLYPYKLSDLKDMTKEGDFLLAVSSYVRPPPFKWEDFQAMLEENQMLQYLKEEKEKEIFRINNIKTKVHGGWTGQYLSYLNLEMLYGGYSTWYPEFYIYLGLANNYPAKFYGMLNTKYVYSNEMINISGFRFFREFPECSICGESVDTDGGIDGPYLYLNEMYLPRAYIADNGVLVVGDEEAVKQTAYGLLLNDNFNPANTVVIMGEKGKIDNYDIEFLKRFDAIFLGQGSIDQNSRFILEQYVNSGGILLPDLVNGVNSVSLEELDAVLSSFGGDYSDVNEVDISLYTPNKRVMDLKGDGGFLVTADKYFWYEGWKARIDGEPMEILRANGMNSAIYLEGEQGELIVKYSPKSFRNGLIILLITLSLIITYFSYHLLYKKSRDCC